MEQRENEHGPVSSAIRTAGQKGSNFAQDGDATWLRTGRAGQPASATAASGAGTGMPREAAPSASNLADAVSIRS